MSQIDKWNEKRKRKNQRKGHPIQAANVPLTPAPDLPKSIRVDDLRVDGDIDLSFFDTLEPDQTFMVNPTGAEQDQIYTVNINDQTGQPEVQAVTPTDITTAPPTTSDVASDQGTPAWAFDPNVDSGPGWMKIRWLLASGTTADPLFYNVFMDTTPGFSINFATNLVSQTFALEAVITLDGAGDQVRTDTEYYFKVQAISDLSGNNALSGEVGPFSPAEIDATVTTIAHINAATIDVGLIDASQLNANSVMANTINSIMVDTQTMLAGDETGNYVKIDENGIVMHNADGDVVVLPTDGSPAVFTGRIIANELTVINGATIQGDGNTLDDAAVLTLTDTQVDPTIAPTVAPFRNYLQGSGGGTTVDIAQGWHVDEGDQLGYRCVSRTSDGDVFGEKWSTVDMSYISRVALTDMLNTSRGVSHIYTPAGVARIGTNMYWLVIDITPVNPVAWLIKTTTAAPSTVTATANLGTIPNSTDNATLGTDGTVLIYAYWDDANENVELSFRNTSLASTGVPITLFGPPDPPLDDAFIYLTGIVYDSNDDLYWVAFTQSFGAPSTTDDFVSAFDASTGDYVPNRDWYLDNFGTNQLCGLTLSQMYSGTNFYYLREQATSPRLYWTEPLDWTTETDYYHFAYRWHDGTPGTHQTAASPITSLSMTKYRRFSVSMTTPSPGSLKRYPLVVRKSTVPAATELRDQGRSNPYIDHFSETFLRFLSYNGSGTLNSPNASTFGAGNSRITGTGTNVTDPWLLEGDGTMDLTVATAGQRDAAYPAPDLAQIIARSEDRVVEVYDGDTWGPLVGLSPRAFRKRAMAFTDCGQIQGSPTTNTAPNDGWLMGFTGTGSTVTDTAATAHGDIWTIRMGTTASTSFSNVTKWRDYPYTAASKITWAAMIRVANASNATDRFDVAFGFMDSTDPRAVSNGVFVRYSDSKATPAGTASTWDLVHCNGGARSADALDDNGGALSLNAGNWLIIEVEHIPGTGTSVWLTDPATGVRTKKVTNYATNLPAASVSNCQLRLLIKRAAGSSNNRDLDVDWLYTHIEYASDRLA